METGCHVMSPSGPNLSLADAHVIDASRLIDTVNQGGAALAAAKAGVGEAQATVAETQSNLARLQQVYKLSGGKVPSKTELDAGRANYSRSMASVRSAGAQVLQARAQLRSEERRGGKEWVRTCRSRWSPAHKKKKKEIKTIEKTYCLYEVFVFLFKQKTAYDVRISDWSSDVCSSDLALERLRRP